MGRRHDYYKSQWRYEKEMGSRTNLALVLDLGGGLLGYSIAGVGGAVGGGVLVWVGVIIWLSFS
jgi:hypothetical protein